MKTPWILILLLIISIPVYSQNNQYEVYAIRYDYGYSMAASDVAVGAKKDDTVGICNMFWFLKGDNNRNILIDAGDLDSMDKPNYYRPDRALKELNINPEDITDIVITHPHFDHIAGLSLFPYGKIWMQKADFNYFVVDTWREKDSTNGFRKQDVLTLIDASLNGRLSLVEGDSIEIIPGIKVFTGSKHTMENQYLQVNSKADIKIVLASDAIWFYYNFDKMLPITMYVLDPVSYVNAMKRMKSLVSDTDLIIPGHDNLVFSRFPKASESAVLIKKDPK